MISDASPLIIFGRLRRLEILKELIGRIDICEKVYEEVVVRGAPFPDAKKIKELCEINVIIVHPLTQLWQKQATRISDEFSLDLGEAHTIALALQRKESEILIDERAGREAAKAHKIRPRGCLGVLVMAYQKRVVTEKVLLGIVEEMISSNYRLSSEVIIGFYKILEKMRRKQ